MFTGKLFYSVLLFPDNGLKMQININMQRYPLKSLRSRVHDRRGRLQRDRLITCSYRLDPIFVLARSSSARIIHAGKE